MEIRESDLEVVPAIRRTLYQDKAVFPPLHLQQRIDCISTTMGDSAYSFSLTTFSRTGKLLQIEYALNAVANGRTALGICAVDGVVLATDKKLPSVLVDSDEVHKIETITPSTGFCYSGVGPDYRVLGKTLGAGETYIC
jgi:hypothetical protein